MINETEDKQGRAGTPVIQGVARVLLPNRAQVELRASDLESLLPEGHRARVVWAYVEQTDLSGRRRERSDADRTGDPVCVVVVRHGRGCGQCAGDCAADAGP
jgi:hypothetical protein